jgi:hypothetical protein
MSFISYLLELLLCISVFTTATSQAQEKCNCSPFEYTFQLNLHPSNPNFAECPWPPSSLGPGVEWYNCIDDLEDIKHIAGSSRRQPVKITEAHFLSQDGWEYIGSTISIFVRSTRW